jgi:hypothetical protein
MDASFRWHDDERAKVLRPSLATARRPLGRDALIDNIAVQRMTGTTG